jgi:predicted dehydrogenase
VSFRTVVVGYGKSMHVRLFHATKIRATDGLELTGICGRNPALAAEVEKSFQCSYVTDFEAVLADPRVDLIVITTPSHLHADMAMRALAAGKHVVVEKPMCLNAAEAAALVAAADAAGRVLSVFQNRRWDADFLGVREAVARGDLGRVFSVSLTYTDLRKPSGWRTQRQQGGGVVYDVGAHLIDQALQLAGTMPQRLYAHLDRVWDMDAESYARIMLEFPDGTLGDLEISHAAWIQRPRWFVLGDKGALRYEGGKLFLKNASGEQELSLPAGDGKGFYPELAESLAAGRQPPVTGQQAATVVRVTDAVFESAATHTAVSIPLV